MESGTVSRANQCKRCETDDVFTDIRWNTMNGIELKVKVTYCNHCGDRERQIFVIPDKEPEREIYHDSKQEGVWHVVETQPNLGEIKGTTRSMIGLGYSGEQAKLIGNIDYMFEEAVRLGLCTGDEALNIGRTTGLIFGKHTGKL